MQVLKRYYQAMQSLPLEIQTAEAELEQKEELFVSRSDRKENGGGYCRTGELFVRAGSAKMGLAYTQDLERDPAEVIAEAWKNGLCAENAEAVQVNGGVPEIIEEKRSREYSPSDMKTLPDLKQWAERIEEELYKIKYPVRSAQVKVARIVRKLGVTNSKGLYVTDENLYYFASIQMTAECCGVAAAEFDLTARKLEELFPAEICRRAESCIGKHLETCAIKSGVMPCVLDGSVMANLFFTAWKMFSGKNYITGNSRLSGKLRQRLSDSDLAITDYADDPYGGNRVGYDCEGTMTRNIVLVKSGVMTGLLHNLDSAQMCHMEPTGNAGRKETLSGVIPLETLITPRNLVIEAGKKTTEMLIHEMKDGIYICQSFDEFHSFNYTSGQYSIPCQGIIVENGKYKGRAAKNLTINGNIVDLLADIEDIGCEMYSFPMSTLDSFTVHAPAVKVKKIKVSA